MIDRGIAYEHVIILGLFTLVFFIIFNLTKIIRYIYKRRKGETHIHQSDKLIGRKRSVYLFARSLFYMIDAFLVLFLLYCSYDLTGDPHVNAQFPINKEMILDNETPIYVLFNRPIDPEIIKPYIHPEVEGEWVVLSVDETFPNIKRKLVFYPKWSLPLNEKVFLYFAGITNPYANKEPWEFGLDSATPLEINSVSVNPEIGSLDIPTDNTEIIFTFDQPAGMYYEWNVIFDPVIEFEKQISTQQLRVNIHEKLTQSTKYTYTLTGVPIRKDLVTKEIVEVTGDPVEFLKGDFETVKQPLLDIIEPQGSKVLPDAVVKIGFDSEMEHADPSKYLIIEPSVLGSASWIDEKTITYEHEPFLKETEYTLKVEKGLRTKVGGILEQELSSNFTTIGKVVLESTSPANSSTGVSIGTNIVMTFDQEVDHTSAQERFKVTPSVSGEFSWNGASLTFNPSNNLSYSTKYTLNFDTGIKSIIGLDSVTDFTFSFTTQAEQFKLNVPIYYQKLRFSCNLEATRMALAYRGIYKEVLTLHSEIAKDTTPYDEVNNIFGNPYEGYTGDIYGVTKGYGVYWSPISALISKYRANSIKTGWNLTGLLSEVQAGNPVVIWAHNGYSYAGNEYFWKTPDGETIRAVTGMHSYVVVGYKGSIDDPSHIIVNDSNRGVWTITTSYFLSLWGYFNNTGVVVY